MGPYQCGLLHGKSTVDATHILRQIMEKVHRDDIHVDMLFVVFDSIRRGKCKLVLKNLL